MKRNTFAKSLEAVGVASCMIALVQGFHGDEWGELYFFLGGIAVFGIGWMLEKKVNSGQ